MYLMVFFDSMDGDGRNGRAPANGTVAALEDAAADMTKRGYTKAVSEESF